MGTSVRDTIYSNCQPYQCPTCKATVVYRPCYGCWLRSWMRAKREGGPLPPLPDYLRSDLCPKRPRRAKDG